MFLTSPLIEQALSQLCAFCSLDGRRESAKTCAMAMLRQLVLGSANVGRPRWTHFRENQLLNHHSPKTPAASRTVEGLEPNARDGALPSRLFGNTEIVDPARSNTSRPVSSHSTRHRG